MRQYNPVVLRRRLCLAVFVPEGLGDLRSTADAAGQLPTAGNQPPNCRLMAVPMLAPTHRPEPRPKDHTRCGEMGDSRALPPTMQPFYSSLRRQRIHSHLEHLAVGPIPSLPH